MVAHQADVLSRVFRALGDPTRREMLRQLSKCGRTVGELGAPFRMSRAATGKRWLAQYERFWNERLDALDSLLAQRRKARSATENEGRTR